jgi:outer membrane protein
MKKLLLVGALALFAAVNAQETSTEGFAKGNTFITGAVGFGSTSEGDAKTNAFTISPSVGYFVTPNIAVGARVGLTTSKDSDKVAGVTLEEKSNLFTAGLFGRYYWMPASRFSIFAELGADYGTEKITTETPVGEFESKYNGFNIGFAPGINYFLSSNFALEAKVGVLGYNSTKPDVDGAESTDKFNIGLNLNDISLGLVYKF